MKLKETKLFGLTKSCIALAAILGYFVAVAFTHSAVIIVFSVAVLLTILFCGQPSLFRDSSGSRVPIFCFLAVAWLGAIAMGLNWFFSRH